MNASPNYDSGRMVDKITASMEMLMQIEDKYGYDVDRIVDMICKFHTPPQHVYALTKWVTFIYSLNKKIKDYAYMWELCILIDNGKLLVRNEREQFEPLEAR